MVDFIKKNVFSSLVEEMLRGSIILSESWVWWFFFNSYKMKNFKKKKTKDDNSILIESAPLLRIIYTCTERSTRMDLKIPENFVSSIKLAD